MEIANVSSSVDLTWRTEVDRFLVLILLVSFGSWVGAGRLTAGGYGKQRAAVADLAKLTQAPAMREADGYVQGDHLKAIYYDGLDWKGKPTRVFAWLGLPAGVDAQTGGKVPGVVLVHGGGGTAFKSWVQKWNAKGFAAISIAVEGQTDRKSPSGSKSGAWSRHAWAGPARQGIYKDATEKVLLADQWMYHAVADTILANSLLRSLPEVDPSKVGVMGISWGGVITSTVIGIDHRFAFGIPTYGCGGLSTAKNQYGQALGNHLLYQNVWDPALRFESVMTPTLWLSWPGDRHFPMDHFAASYSSVRGPRAVCLVPKLGHGHRPPWNAPDSYAFAESVLRTGKPWCEPTNSERKEGSLQIDFVSSKRLAKSVLVWTADTGLSGERRWNRSPARLTKQADHWAVRAELPEGATAWFVNVLTDDGLTVSSDYQEQP